MTDTPVMTSIQTRKICRPGNDVLLETRMHWVRYGALGQPWIQQTRTSNRANQVIGRVKRISHSRHHGPMVIVKLEGPDFSPNEHYRVPIGEITEAKRIDINDYSHLFLC